MDPIFSVIIRTVIIYLFIIFAIRLFGKKELAQLSVVDLVFILLISNAVQNAMVGDNTTLIGGLTAAASLFLINSLLKLGLYRSRRFSQIIQGNPLMLIYKGHVIKKHLEEAQVTMEELEAAVREHGTEHIGDVDLAVLEVDGNISVLTDDFHRKSVRKRKGHKIVSKYE